MKRQEFLLNLTLLVIIGVLVYLIYDSRDLPRGLDELKVPLATSTAKSTKSGKPGKSAKSGKSDSSETSGTDRAAKAPGTETDYAPGDAPDTDADPDKDTDGEAGEKSKEVAAAGGRSGNFGKKNLFRALLTPTPTPTPTQPPPPPTPDIAKSLGAWKLLSVYQGKALMEDVQISQQGGEGAIWEMNPGDKKQVDVGNGIMKTATLKAINNENPYSPEVTFSMEDTTEERKIDLDTEPAAAAPQKK